MRHWCEADMSEDCLITILRIPKADFSTREVWTGVCVSHSSLRGTSGDNELVYYGNKLGSSSAMGVCISASDFVDDCLVNTGCVYVNRYDYI